MNTNTIKTLKVIGLIVLIAAIYGGYVFPQAQNALVTATPGTTYVNQKAYGIIWSPSSTAASTTSLYNSDSTSRIVESLTYYCESINNPLGATGVGFASWSWNVATSSVAGNLVGNTNYVFNSTVSTTTASAYIASTTPGSTGSTFVRVWGAGQYLVVTPNATSTATCNVNVNTLSY